MEGDCDEQAQQLVHDLVAYLDEMSDAAYELEQVHYQELKRVILETIKPDPTHPSQQASGCDQEEDVGYDDDRASEEEEKEEDRALMMLRRTFSFTPPRRNGQHWLRRW